MSDTRRTHNGPYLAKDGQALSGAFRDALEAEAWRAGDLLHVESVTRCGGFPGGSWLRPDGTPWKQCIPSSPTQPREGG